MNLKPPPPLAFIVFLLAGWISRPQLVVIEYLKAENRMLRERSYVVPSMGPRIIQKLGRGLRGSSVVETQHPTESLTPTN